MKSTFTLSRIKRILLTSISVVFLLSGSIASVANAYTFPGGGGTGCTGQWCTGPGNINAGWKLFDLSGGGPGGNSGRGFVLNSPTTWATVQSNCTKYPGITKAFIFVTQSLYGSTPYLGLNYVAGQDPGTPGYQDADPGAAYNYYVEAVNYDPGTASGSWGSTVAAFCFFDNPPWNVSVNTTASINGSATAGGQQIGEVGDTITWSHSVTNGGPAATNKQVNYTANNKQGFTGATGGNGSMGQGAWSSSTNSTPYTVKASDFGNNLCRSTTASPSSNTGGSLESSDSCVRIAKKPKVQVYGGDVSAGRAIGSSGSMTSVIVGSQTKSNNITFGSWGEYGLVASGAIQGAGSGAAFYQNGLANVSTACDYSKLSVTNTSSGNACTANTIGNYSNAGTIPDVGGQFAVQLNSTPVYGGGDLSDAQYKRVEQVKNSSVTITGGKLTAGQWLVINAPGATVNITGNITYDNGYDHPSGNPTYKSIDDIPQLIIIANSINIDQGVGEVDAWLVASGSTGSIHTCTQGVGVNLYAGICNNKLDVYGPVMAKHLFLERTAGALGSSPGDKGFGDPAETFHLVASAYLWGAARSVEGLHVNVAATSDLPPRF